MAIIAILAGIMSLAVSGFVRDARIETNNEKARMIYMAFQDILIDCEVKQDVSMFEPHGVDGERTDDLIGAVVFFRVSDVDINDNANINGLYGLGDEIHIMCMHSNPTANTFGAHPNLCSRSVWMDGSTNLGQDDPASVNNSADHGASYWKKLNTYISKRMDASMDGTYVVAVDLENYQVLSVICRELSDGKDPKTGLYSPSEVHDGRPLSNYINAYTSATVEKEDGSTVTVDFPVQIFLVKDIAQEKNIVKKSGIYIGSYPLGDMLYSNITPK